MDEEKKTVDEVLQAYDFGGEVAGALRYGEGHINDTYAVYLQTPQGEAHRFILQRINEHVFHRPMEVMENIIGVTRFLRRVIEENGGDPMRETLNLLPTKVGEPVHIDQGGGCWRCYYFIEDTLCLQRVERPEQFYESARAFGNFQRMLSGYPAKTLHESIPRFHDTPQRLQQLQQAVSADAVGRCKAVLQEIEFALAREADCGVLLAQLARKELPLRVTHNDTKLNNVLIDKHTGKGICVIDLDTIMPGLSANDFGDSIRFGASTAAEDERDLNKVTLDMDLFTIYTKGFLETAGGVLTPKERESLIWGAKLMTLECGIRFLADHINGDVYFKIHREGHNLDRCRTQFKLVEDMEKKWPQMQAVVDNGPR